MHQQYHPAPQASPSPTGAPGSGLLSSLATDSSMLLGLGRPLSKVPAQAPSMQANSRIPGKLDSSVAWAENVRLRSSVAYDDNGSAFTLSRITSEYYPIPACSISDIRRVSAKSPAEVLMVPQRAEVEYAPFVVGAPTRLLGREPRVTSSYRSG